MQTMAPPDGELKQRFSRIDERFDEVNRRITDGREEAKQRFDEVNRRISEGKEETGRRFDEAGKRFDRVEGDIRELKKSVVSIQESVVSIHTTLTRISIGLALTFASVIITKAL
jgi:predicted  nucleic acid-binding Zn-ribbon protein